MKISIQSANDFRLPSYDIEFDSVSQPFQHTDIKRTGPIGSIQFIKTDLNGCSILLINSTLDKPATIQVQLSELVYQLFLQLPYTTQHSEVDANQAPAVLSKVNTIQISIPALQVQLLFIHYAIDYLIKYDNRPPDKLFQLLETNNSLSGIPLSLTAASFSIFKQIISASLANKVLYSYLKEKADELLPSLWQSVQQGKSTTRLSGKEIEMLLKVKEIIAADLSQSHTKFSLSKIVGGDAYSLSKIFKEWYGIPIRQFIHISRMEKARDLLKSSDLAIKKITFAVGYKNISNFSESFKSYYGYSPSQVRESGDFSTNP
jgi:AraC-like DNA-binding protein